jgi:hypothetical protein
MNWVNTPPCAVCGCKECEMKTVRGPETPEEKDGQAKRVEGKKKLHVHNNYNDALCLFIFTS